MKKFLDLSSWSRWSLSLSKGAAIGSMLIMAFAVVGCDDDQRAQGQMFASLLLEGARVEEQRAGTPEQNIPVLLAHLTEA